MSLERQLFGSHTAGIRENRVSIPTPKSFDPLSTIFTLIDIMEANGVGVVGAAMA